MAHDVFISHSSKDKVTADAVCAVLESKGFRCWVAPRDITPGKEWSASIVEAIKNARLMVLVFSGHANESPHISREVERAASRRIPIVPIRIEHIAPTEALEYFLSARHWLDALTPPMERHLEYLAKVVGDILHQEPRNLPLTSSEAKPLAPVEDVVAQRLAQEQVEKPPILHSQTAPAPVFEKQSLPLKPQPPNANRLFLASCISLATTAMVSQSVGPGWVVMKDIYYVSDRQLSILYSSSAWSFALAIVTGGLLCDAIGLGRLLATAWGGHLVGILLSIFGIGYGYFYSGALLIAIANGFVMAACIPLIATLYSDNRTTKINHLLVWLPGGSAIAIAIAYLVEKAGLFDWSFPSRWRLDLAALFVPLVAYGLLFFRQSFPKTERVQMGASTGSMWLACANPRFLLMAFCMLLTSYVTLLSSTWLPSILRGTVIPGNLIALATCGLTVIGRQGAGPFVRQLSPIGVLIASSVVSFAALLLMRFSGGFLFFFSVAVLTLGACFFVPTLLGYVSERFPTSGALGLALMGVAEMLGYRLFGPSIGAGAIGWSSSMPDPDLFTRSGLADPAGLCLAILFFIFVTLKVFSWKYDKARAAR